MPWMIIVERQTFAAVWAGGVVLALADQSLLHAFCPALYTVAAVTVTLTPASATEHAASCVASMNDTV